MIAENYCRKQDKIYAKACRKDRHFTHKTKKTDSRKKHFEPFSIGVVTSNCSARSMTTLSGASVEPAVFDAEAELDRKLDFTSSNRLSCRSVRSEESRSVDPVSGANS